MRRTLSIRKMALLRKFRDTIQQHGRREGATPDIPVSLPKANGLVIGLIPTSERFVQRYLRQHRRRGAEGSHERQGNYRWHAYCFRTFALRYPIAIGSVVSKRRKSAARPERFIPLSYSTASLLSNTARAMCTTPCTTLHTRVAHPKTVCDERNAARSDKRGEFRGLAARNVAHSSVLPQRAWKG